MLPSTLRFYSMRRLINAGRTIRASSDRQQSLTTRSSPTIATFPDPATPARFNTLTPMHRIRSFSSANDDGNNTSDRATYDNSESSSDRRIDDLRRELMLAALPFVAVYGWSERAVARAVEELGYPGVSHRIFQRGGVDLVLEFIRHSNEQLRDRLPTIAAANRTTTDSIRHALRERLEMNAPIVRNLPEALALLASSAPESLAALGELVDDVWYAAGDRSVGLDWYSKRASLAAVYTSSELYMLQDYSEDFQETWYFLDRRLDAFRLVGRASRTARETFNSLCDDAPAVTSATVETLKNLAGVRRSRQW